MFELTNCRFYRETYAVASKYLDMFFAKGNDVEINSLQTFARKFNPFALRVWTLQTKFGKFSGVKFQMKGLTINDSCRKSGQERKLRSHPPTVVRFTPSEWMSP